MKLQARLQLFRLHRNLAFDCEYPGLLGKGGTRAGTRSELLNKDSCFYGEIKRKREAKEAACQMSRVQLIKSFR